MVFLRTVNGLSFPAPIKQPQKQNNLNSGRKNSIWHYSPPNFIERQFNKLLTLTKFTQTDLTALAKADCNIVVIFKINLKHLQDRLVLYSYFPYLVKKEV